MNVKIKALTAGVIFFMGGATVMAQKKDSADTKQIEEVVVTGYSTAKKNTYTGSLKVVDSKQLEKKNVSNVSQALAGEVAGVRVINTSGQPGTVGTVRIRGLSSLNGGKSPLYVVDGIPFSGNLDLLNPNDIESTTVLKDATSTAIYGSRGANGVVLITTKSGRKGTSYVEFESKIGTNLQLLPRYDVIKDPDLYIAYVWEGLYNQGVGNGNANPVNYANTNLFSGNGIDPKYNMWNVADGSQLIDPNTRKVLAGVTRRYTPENWEDYAFQGSMRTENNVNFGGSTGSVKYFTSIGHLNDIGYSINSSFDRVTGRSNVSYDVKPWLKIGTNLNYSKSLTKPGGQASNSNSVFWVVDGMPSIYPLFTRDASGNIVKNIYGDNDYDYGIGRGFAGLTNAIGNAYYTLNQYEKKEFNGNFTADFKLMDGLTFETKYGHLYSNRKWDYMDDKYFGPSSTTNGSISKQDEEQFSTNFLKLLRYKNDFGLHSIEALAAHENNDYRYKFLSAYKTQMGLPIPEFDQAVKVVSASSYTEDVKLESFFGQANYSYNQKYNLSASIRRDGSSRFRNNKWGTFFSLGGAWTISSEDFMKNQNVVSYAKLKASYGTTGDQSGISYYSGYDRYSVVPNSLDQPAFNFSAKGNPDLTWEKSKMTQVGVELGFFNRINLNVDLYSKVTDNLLFERREPTSQGYAILLVNDGALENKGLEFDLAAKIVKKDNFTLDFSLNGEMFTNKLTKMPIDPATGNQKVIDISGVYGRAVGHSIFDFYMPEWAGVNSQTGLGQWNQYWVDLNNDGVVNDNGGAIFGNGMEVILNYEDFISKNPDLKSQVKTGVTSKYARSTNLFVGKSAIPKVRGGFNLSTGFYNFDFSVQFLYSIGGYAYDGAYASFMNNYKAGNGNWHTDIANRWQKPGDITDVPRLNNGVDTNVSSASTRFLIDASYLSLNNIRLGYTLPKKYFQNTFLSGINIYVSGDNLWLLTKRKGLNPTVSETGASSVYTYNPLSTLTFGTRIRF